MWNIYINDVRIYGIWDNIPMNVAMKAAALSIVADLRFNIDIPSRLTAWDQQDLEAGLYRVTREGIVFEIKRED